MSPVITNDNDTIQNFFNDASPGEQILVGASNDVYVRTIYTSPGMQIVINPPKDKVVSESLISPQENSGETSENLVIFLLSTIGNWVLWVVETMNLYLVTRGIH